MVNSRFAPRAAGGAVLLLCLAVLFAGPSLYASLGRRLEASARDIQASIEGRTGLMVSFSSLSPSILRGLSIGWLDLRDSRGRSILKARKAYARYDLLSLFFPSRGGLIRELRIEDASIILDPEAIALLAKLGRGSNPGGEGAAMALRVPPIALSGTRIVLRLEGFAMGPVSAELSTFRLGGEGKEVSLDLGGSFSASAMPGLGSLSVGVSASGTLERSLERARLHLSVSAVSDLFSLRPQSLELVYGGGILELRKIEDKAPIDAWLRLDTASLLLEARLQVEGFIPSRSFIPGLRLRALEPWFELPYTGRLSLRLPLSEPRLISYEGRLSGRLPSSLLGEGYQADISASGNLERMDVTLARLEGPPGSASFTGDLDFHDLAPSGHLDLDLRLLRGRLPIVAGIDILSTGGSYSLRSASPLLGGLRLEELEVQARRQGEEFAVVLSLLLPEARASTSSTSGLEASRFSCVANIGLGPQPSLRAELDIESSDLAAARPLLSSLLAPGVASFLSSLRVGGELALRSDFKSFNYSTKEFSISSSADPSMAALLSISGSEKNLVLEEGRIRYGSSEALAKGSAEFAGSHGLGFAVQLSLGGQNYSLEGALAGGSLHGSGNYGLEFSSRKLEGETFISVQAKDLPIPGLGLPLLASFDADGRYSEPSAWSLALSRLDLDLPGKDGSDRRLSLSGLFGPGSGAIPDLHYQDGISELSGTAKFGYGASMEGIDVAAGLSGGEGESYALRGSYKGGSLDLALKASASPLARVWKGPISGAIGGEVGLRGRLDDLRFSFDLGLDKGRYQSEALALKARGDWGEGLLSIQDCSVSWKGYTLDAGKGSLDSTRADLRLSGNLRAMVGSSTLKTALDIHGFVPDGPSVVVEADPAKLGRFAGLLGLAGKGERYRVEGLAKNLVYKGRLEPEWPFVLNILPTAIAFDGGKDELVFDFRDDGHFSLEARPPFPLQASLEGVLAEGQIDAEARGLNIDLPFALGLLGKLPLDISAGRLSGNLRVHGPVANPDMDGALALDGLFLTVPGWVTSPVGPLNAPVIVSGKQLSLLAPYVAAGDAALMVEASADISGWLPRDIRGRAKTLTASPLSASAKVLGASMSGQALLDLDFGFSGGIASIKGSVSLQKARVIIDPTGFKKKGGGETPATFFDVDISLAVGPGVKVYFPSPDLPVVMGYADPASALRIIYDQESGDLSFKGNVFLRGGEVFYVQRDFFLKSARIVFNENEDKFDPHISFLAERRARNGDGSVLISLKTEDSPLFNFQPKLSSSPVMSEGQIVSLLGANLLGAEDTGNITIVRAAIMGSEMLPQLNVAKAFEEKVRDALGLDIFFVQTDVVQRWLYDISGTGQGAEAGSLASYLDDTSIYLGKYLGDTVFVHAAALLQKDPLVPSGPLRLDSEFGVELEAPFGTITWNVKPESPESLFISDQSLSLTWKVRL